MTVRLVQHLGKGKHRYTTHTVTVPKAIADALLAVKPREAWRFEVSLTEQGMLYTPIEVGKGIPEWLQGEDDEEV